MNSKKILTTKFKISAYECNREFSGFMKAFSHYLNAKEQKQRYAEGDFTFGIVEYQNPEDALQKKYIFSVNIAIKELIKLNTAFKIATGETFLSKLEKFEDYIEVLETILDMAR